MNTHTRGFKKFLLFLKSSFFLCIILFLFFGMIYLNFYFKVRKINLIFFDENSENLEIKNYTEKLVRERATNVFSYLFLSEEEITEQLHKEYQIVSKAKISKSLSLDLNVVITKNEEFFYTCVPEDFNFLARCMYGNTDGEYYKGMEAQEALAASSSQKINLLVEKNVLYDLKLSKRIDEPDSLSGARIYTKEDFKVLREVLRWVQKNGFIVSKVVVGELKIVDIYTDMYMIKISLDKSYVDTVKDFEIISRTGNLEEYVNDKKDKIGYIDLSYHNKVFYKLKNPTQSGTTTASSTGTTTIITATSTNQ